MQSTVRGGRCSAGATSAAAVIPPGYLPLRDLTYTTDRPLYAAATRGQIDNAAPFQVPADLPAGGTVDHSEGVAPTEGAMAPTLKTVTPGAVAGRLILTRELIDAANPAADAVALAMMREDFARRVEAKIFNLLNSSAGQGGTVTTGFVPSGAAVRLSTGAALAADLEKSLLVFPSHRGRAPRFVVAAARSAVAEALAGVDLGRLAFRDVDVSQSAAITGTAAGDGDVFILGSDDLYVWQSPLAQFTYEEKAGPHLVELVLFGYAAATLVRPAGLSSLRHT